MAYLSVIMLMMSGGSFTHAAEAHDHLAAASHAATTPHAHTDKSSLDTSASAELHCGASILSLAKEYRLPMCSNALDLAAHGDAAIRPASHSFEPPPPRTAS
ncbi:hypothetical protein [Roseibium aggregatum]|uniref:Uncharacterized protein n=1 Tax=Roseibium aggregatum TaxID=187304 RepID=A0A926P395_9HYPH|nr:hypothetical protein [Roseibium aggregatum]MBD1548778.1 hypothetical protein [Roseibium aggregatum]